MLNMVDITGPSVQRFQHLTAGTGYVFLCLFVLLWQFLLQLPSRMLVDITFPSRFGVH